MTEPGSRCDGETASSDPAAAGPSLAGPSLAGPSLAGPRSPADTGEADPALTAALEAWAAARDASAQARVYAALPSARLFVPLVATLVEAETAPATGLRAEKTSEMSVVTLVAASGATALPAFLSTASLRRWRLDARPVPVTGREACMAARDGGHVAVVVEPGGVTFPVDGPALPTLADGWVPAAGAGGAAPLASRRVVGGLRLTAPVRPPAPVERDALAAALRGEAAVREAYVVDAAVGDEEPARTLGLVLARDLTADGLAALVSRLADGLGPDLGGSGGLDVAVLSGEQRAEAAELVEPVLAAPTPAPTAGAAPRRRWWRRGR